MGDSGIQQHFCGSNLSYALPHRGANLRTWSGARNRMGVGCFPLCHLLAGTRGVGDKPHHFFAEPRTTAYASHGGPTASPPNVDFVRSALGRDRTDQYRDFEHVSILPAVASVSPSPQDRAIDWSSFVRTYRRSGCEPVVAA